MLKISYQITTLLVFTILCSIVTAGPEVITIWNDDQLTFTGGEEIIKLVDKGKPGQRHHISNVQRPDITVYLPDKEKTTGAGVLICPGGGYSILSIDTEGVEIAKWLNSIGVAGFVLKYRLKEHGHPAPLNDAQRAMQIIRSRAKDFNLEADRLGIIGFSAGGHLASSVGTHFSSPNADSKDALEKFSNRPDFMILLYPVISMQERIANNGSKRKLLGEKPSKELVDLMSNELQVSASTPPTFLVHSSDDMAVKVENSIKFYSALIKAKVPAEMHIYEKGGHGFGMRPYRGIAAENWPIRCADWLKQRGLLKPRNEK